MIFGILYTIGVVALWLNVEKGNRSIEDFWVGSIGVFVMLDIIVVWGLLDNRKLRSSLQNNEFQIYEDTLVDKHKRLGRSIYYYFRFQNYSQVSNNAVRVFDRNMYKDAIAGNKYYLIKIGKRKMPDFVYPMDKYEMVPDLARMIIK